MRGDGRGTMFGLTLSAMVLIGVGMVFCAAALIVGRSLYIRSSRAQLSPTWATILDASTATPEPSPAPTTATPMRTRAPAATTVAPPTGPAGTVGSSHATTATPTLTVTPVTEQTPATPTVSTPTPTLAQTATTSPVAEDTPTTTLTPSPSPEATSTATATPVVPTSSAATPTATFAPGWHVLGVTVYQDSGGDARVLGEVLNNTGENQEDVSLVLTFFADDGQQIGETEVWPVVIVVPDGVTVPFEATERLTRDLARYEVVTRSTASSQEARQDLDLLGHSGSRGDPYTIVGEVRNPGPDLPDVGCAWITATLYDGSDEVSGIGYTGVDGIDLRSGRKATFEVTIEDPPPDVVRYELLVLAYADCR